MTRYLISIGAGNSQVPLLRRAGRLGYQVVAVDRNPSAPGFADADVTVVCSTYEPPTCVAALNEVLGATKPEGIVARASGPALYTACAVSAAFDLPGLSERLVRLATIKSCLRRFLKDCNLSGPEGVSVMSTDLSEARSIKLPVVVKPDFPLVGKQAVRLLRNSTEMEIAVAAARQSSYNDKAEIEEYIEGVDCSCLFLLSGGKAVVIAWWDELVACQEDGLFIGLGVSVPSVIVNTAAQKRTEQLVQTFAAQFPEDRGLLLISMRIGEDGTPTIVEVHADMGGDLILDVLLPAANPSVDVFGLAVWIAAGECPPIRPTHLAPTAVYYTDDAAPEGGGLRAHQVVQESTVIGNLQHMRAVVEHRRLRVAVWPRHLEWMRTHGASCRNSGRR